MKTCEKGLHQYIESLKQCPECATVAKKIYRTANLTKVKTDNKIWRGANKEKLEIDKELWRQANKKRIRKYNLKSKFNLTLEQYDQLLAQQNNCCAICLTSQLKFKKEFAVDHCHTTNKIRGLLCTQCNVGIGSLKDDPVLILRAYNYLKEKQ